jgi:hypothetical protein
MLICARGNPIARTGGILKLRCERMTRAAQSARPLTATAFAIVDRPTKRPGFEPGALLIAQGALAPRASEGL